ncbi:MAG: hypothetical protein FJ271_28540 [Planctomycetes bacterium]|nr:hypothetical protein [Planctomycetota bacterium]
MIYSRNISGLVVVLIGLSVIAIFILDLCAPLGAAVWLLYVLPILAAYGLAPVRYQLPLAAVVTALILIGLIQSPRGAPVNVSALNRGLADLMFWVMSMVGAIVYWSSVALSQARGRSEHLATDSERGLVKSASTVNRAGEDGGAVQLSHPELLPRIALTIGAATVVLGAVVAVLAYHSSRSTLRDAVATQNLATSQTVVNESLARMKLLDKKHNPLDVIAETWKNTVPPLSGSYMCVIDSSGKLAIHTARPQLVGTDVSQMLVDQRSGRNTEVVADVTVHRSV